MKLETLIEVLNANQYHYHFIIIKNDGSKERKRMFISNSENPCIFKPRSTRTGYPIYQYQIEDWKEVIPYFKHNNNTDMVIKFMERVVKYLSVSGLWCEMKESYEKILSQGRDYIDHLLSLDYTEQRKELQKIKASFYVDSIIRTATKGIVSINYYQYEKDNICQKIEQALKNRQDYRHSWRKNYDNNVTFSFEKDGKARGWYSTEYKNCGNGHYYFALDSKHAIFGETD